MIKRLFLLFLLTLTTSYGMSTHNRGGNITYEYLGNNTYRVTVFTCTYSDAPADRPQLFDFEWGDGTMDTLERDSIILIPGPTGFPQYNSQKNYYSGIHTYPGPGTYTLCFVDPNRNAGINNIAGSVNVPFSLQTQIIHTGFFGPPAGFSAPEAGNNSVVLDECPCPELACVNQPYCYNIAAYDPDGDSLSYELVPPAGSNCSPLALGIFYVYPDAPPSPGGALQGGGGNMSINPVTGTMCWISPELAGEFNFTIRITEWRKNDFGVYGKMGYVIRDIQLFVLAGNCEDNLAPSIEPLRDTCILAGDNLNIPIIYSDDVFANLSSFGEPFTASPSAFMTPSTGTNPDTTNFIWNTGCTNVKASAYPTYFIAEDNGIPVTLTDIKNMFITVNGPPVTGLTVTPQGNGMNILWNRNVCSNIQGYNIYRRSGTSSYSEDCCSQDAAENMGYTLIGQTNGHLDTTFYDDGDLVIGNDYCYIITARFGPALESCVSDQVCNQLQMDVPVITNVSVSITNAGNGIDQVCWAMPKELDTLVQYGNHAFFYRLMRSPGNAFSGTTFETHVTASSTSLSAVDTCFNDQLLNTVSGPYAYLVELYAVDQTSGDTTYIGQSNEASSVFLSSIPNDNQIELNWTEVVPWNNTSYEVYKETSPGLFSIIATTTQQTYTDTGLVNGATYCYKIRSIGSYTSPGIINPIYNWSQEICESPIDVTPPCPPVLAIDNDCEAEINNLNWTNPNRTCSDDVMSYNLYYAPTENDPFTIIQTFNSEFDTSYSHINNNSLAGCYYVTAVDSVQYSNESEPSNIVCADNCPYYWVPNIITPNGDGDNDFWVPFPYKFIESVDVKVFNRWGSLVFQTTDPDIRWDGRHMDTNTPVNDGTYFFVIIVRTIRLDGAQEEYLKGHLTVVRGSNFTGN